jgi:hypothetical protein
MNMIAMFLLRLIPAISKELFHGVNPGNPLNTYSVVNKKLINLKESEFNKIVDRGIKLGMLFQDGAGWIYPDGIDREEFSRRIKDDFDF